MNVIILVNKKTSRLIYTCEVIFKWIYHIDFQLTTDRSFFQTYEGPKFQYGSTPQDSEALFFQAVPLLFEKDIRVQNPKRLPNIDYPAFFETDTSHAALPYDPLACTFYWISRYEEYLPFQPDQYGRFSAAVSLAGQLELLDQPLVQLWARHIINVLSHAFPSLQPRTPSFSAQPTYDIDVAWAVHHRPWWRITGTVVRSVLTGQWRSLYQRLSINTGQQPDPYAVYNWLDQLHQERKLSPIYFFLVGDYGPFDKNIDHRHPALRQLIQKTAERSTIGLHPSFKSNTSYQQIQEETRRLSSITNRKINRSRQHYLLLRFPDTYRALLKAGFTHDYSMGYADQPGFRAGMALPYPWYDLEQEEATTLMIHPFQVMDITLRNYLGLSPKAALSKCQQLLTITQQFGGTFTTLWHNSSFAKTDGWGGWKEMYIQLLDDMTHIST